MSFIVWLEPVLERLPKSLSVMDQLDRASTSIPLNIAEGNGKFTGADRCRFFDFARGSALESAAESVPAPDFTENFTANFTENGRFPHEFAVKSAVKSSKIVNLGQALAKRVGGDYRLHDGSSE